MVSSALHLHANTIEAKERQFPWFLLCTLLPLFALPFADLQGNTLERLCLPVAVDLLILQSIRCLPRWRSTIGPVPTDGLYRGLGLLGVLTVWVPFLLGHNVPWELRLLFVLIRAGFYVMTAVRIVAVLANSNRVNGSTLCLGAAGYIHLGLTGGQLATALQVVDNDSFRLGSMAAGEELVARLSYFAFVTIGTLGYGDVVPASPIGESFVILLSITSTLYVSLLIGLLLSRYINSRTRAAVADVESEVTR